MSEKYYKPILKDGDHLVRSSKNPDRVRGQSRDANNKLLYTVLLGRKAFCRKLKKPHYYLL